MVLYTLGVEQVLAYGKTGEYVRVTEELYPGGPYKPRSGMGKASWWGRMRVKRSSVPCGMFSVCAFILPCGRGLRMTNCW